MTARLLREGEGHTDAQSFDFSRGFIRELRIHIPWTQILSQPIEIKLYTVELILRYIVLMRYIYSTSFRHSPPEHLATIATTRQQFSALRCHRAENGQ
ncbi:hypothetical protein H257_10044 [Aphanomyces astaci]|uniref:Uncharacterized protein n=1 Tax=Aphanomyces astaci TaxID=112090 RepID=W4G9M9_APHAT|nr:hypothetical protein H257_10044 [Aphanomyces astaci]ETV75648.1 hypothetical protein H257_10044 [Aphanomyces astaci]|eukprot:XP_009834779.1 hypothetical protein H257_10044 [Aphanomyces astaci]